MHVLLLLQHFQRQCDACMSHRAAASIPWITFACQIEASVPGWMSIGMQHLVTALQADACTPLEDSAVGGSCACSRRCRQMSKAGES